MIAPIACPKKSSADKPRSDMEAEVKINDTPNRYIQLNINSTKKTIRKSINKAKNLDKNEAYCMLGLF